MLAVVLLVVLFAAYRDGTGFDILRRYLHYGRAEQVGGETVYHFDASSKNRFALLGESLAVLSDASLSLYNSAGQEVWSTPVTMTAPALVSGGGRAAAYDVGGTSLYVLDQSGPLLELTADEEEPYISATLNQNGELAVTAQKKGYKGSVKVYDRALGPDPSFEFKSSQRFVLDGYVFGEHLAAVTLGQENGVFVSSIGLYDLSKDAKEPAANYSISGGLVAAIGEQEGRLTTVSDAALTFANTGGEITGTYAYGGSYLREYDLRSPGRHGLCRAAAEPLPLRQRGAACHRGQERRGPGLPGCPGGGAGCLRLRPVSGGALCRPSGGLQLGSPALCHPPGDRGSPGGPDALRRVGAAAVRKLRQPVFALTA